MVIKKNIKISLVTRWQKYIKIVADRACKKARRKIIRKFLKQTKDKYFFIKYAKNFVLSIRQN